MLRKKRTHFTYLFLFYWTVSQSPCGYLRRPERSSTSHPWAEAAALTPGWKPSVCNLPRRRTMLLISPTTFPREQKLPTPHRKSFSRRYLVGEAPGTPRGENIQAVPSSAKRHKLWILWGLAEVSGTFYFHVTRVCFTQAEVADFRGPLPALALSR